MVTDNLTAILRLWEWHRPTLTHAEKHSGEDRVDQAARSGGLNIYLSKTKMMKLKTKSTTKTTLRNVELEEVQDSKYLGSYISAASNIEEITTRVGPNTRL